MVEIPRAVCGVACLSTRKTRHGVLIFAGSRNLCGFEFLRR
jgi:hypothetical protein